MKVVPVSKRRSETGERADGPVRDRAFRTASRSGFEMFLRVVDLFTQCRQKCGGLRRIETFETTTRVLQITDGLCERQYRRHFGDLFIRSDKLFCFVVQVVLEQYEIDLLVRS